MARLGTRGLFSTFEFPRQNAFKKAVCHSTDCMSFSTDCQRLPGKHELPDVDKAVLLDWRGRGIVGSEKATEIYGADVAVTKKEVSGLHAGKHDSWHIGGPNLSSEHVGPSDELVLIYICYLQIKKR